MDEIISEMSHEMVKWDDEVQDMLDQHSLLNQLALGGDCFVDEETMPIVQVDIHDEQNLDAACHVFTEMSINNALAETPCTLRSVK